MKKLSLAVLVGMLAAIAPISAHAAPTTFTGGCGFRALNDVTPGGQMGGQDTWNGEVELGVIPTTAGVPNGSPVTASCEFKVNGVSQGTVLGPISGVGFVGGVGQFQYVAGITDVVTLCTHVSSLLGGNETVCADAVVTQVVPQPVVDAIDLVFTAVVDVLNDAILSQLDPTICPVLASLAPGVGPVIIDNTGDVWIGSTNPEDKFYDCPPYDA